MPSSLIPCGSCGRHVRGGAPRCPFCHRGPLRCRAAQLALVAASSLVSTSALASELGDLDAGVDAASPTDADAGAESSLDRDTVPIYGAPVYRVAPGCRCELAKPDRAVTSPLVGMGLVAAAALRRRQKPRAR